MSRWRILAVSEGYLHKLICFWTALNHSSTDLPPCLKLVSKSNRALTSFDCGLQKSSNLVHNVFKVSSLLVKPHDTTKSIPSSPDHDMSFLHCLVSDRVASSQSKMFSHFSFHFRNRWYKPSLTVQSILRPSMYGTNCCSCVWRLVGWASVDAGCSQCEADWFLSLREFLVFILYYFCGALDDLVSGQKSTQYTLTWVIQLLVLSEEGWTFHWIAAELLSSECRFVYGCAEALAGMRSIRLWRIPVTMSLNSTWPGWKTAWSVYYKPNSLPSLIHKKRLSSKSESKHFWHHVLSLCLRMCKQIYECVKGFIKLCNS